jgi:hypothetical protein
MKLKLYPYNNQIKFENTKTNLMLKGYKYVELYISPNELMIFVK